MSNRSVKFEIGERVFEVPPLSFRQLERNWERIQELGADGTMFSSVRQSVAILADLVGEDPEGLLDELTARQSRSLDRSMSELFRVSGMVPEEGDSQSGEADAASLRTGTGSSLN